MTKGTSSQLRAWRQRRKRTLAEQAAAFEVTPATLSRLETGVIQPSPQLVRRIYKVTRGKVDPNMVFGVPARRKAKGATKKGAA